MAHPPRDAPNPSGYLVAAPLRRQRAPRLVALVAAAAVVVLGGAALAAALLTGSPATATPSLTPAAPVADAVPAAATASPTPDAGFVLSTSSNGRAMALALPDATEPIGRVVVFADRGVDAQTAIAADDAVALTLAGWAVAAFDGAGSDFGSPASQTATAELLTWSGEQVPRGPLVIATYGTGAATAITGVALAGAEPACWASSDPVTDLFGAAAADEALQDEILTAWGRVPAEADLPRAYVDDLPTATAYRVLAPAPSASTTAREDAATLVSALEESGHDATTVESGAARADLLTALRGCDA